MKITVLKSLLLLIFAISLQAQAAKKPLLLGSIEGTFVTVYEKGSLNGEVVYQPSAENEPHKAIMKVRTGPNEYKTHRIDIENSALDLIILKDGWIHNYIADYSDGSYELESSLKTTPKFPKGFSVEANSHPNNKTYFTALDSPFLMMSVGISAAANTTLTPTEKRNYKSDPEVVTKISFDCRRTSFGYAKLKCKTKLKVKSVLYPKDQ